MSNGNNDSKNEIINVFMKNIKNGNFETVKHILDYNYKDVKYQLDSALKISAMKDYLELVIYLLFVGADINILDRSTLRNIQENHKKVYQFLVDEYDVSNEKINEEPEKIVDRLIEYNKVIYKYNEDYINRKIEGYKDSPDIYERLVGMNMDEKLLFFSIDTVHNRLNSYLIANGFQKHQLPKDINECMILKIKILNIKKKPIENIEEKLEELTKEEEETLKNMDDDEIYEKLTESGVEQQNFENLPTDERRDYLALVNVRHSIWNDLRDDWNIKENKIPNDVVDALKMLIELKEINALINEQEEKVYEKNMESLDDVKDSNEIFNECFNKEDIVLGDELDTRKGIVFIVDIVSDDKYHAYCFGLDQLRKIFKGSRRVYEWGKENNEPILDKPVFKLPHRGDFIDKHSYELTKIYNTFVLRLHRKKSYLGSEFGVSQMHGEEQDRHDIYTLMPIHHSTLVNKHKISLLEIANFEPLPDDYNQYYEKYNIEW